ncbi:MAG: Biopolymer transport protein ExbB [Lentisphaerae bacterium ADurb.BinA184]|nr:MAG: Biopolymer transport protein ExbB [Lentisphaerae bacterium ADurb.BinA184]
MTPRSVRRRAVVAALTAGLAWLALAAPLAPAADDGAPPPAADDAVSQAVRATLADIAATTKAIEEQTAQATREQADLEREIRALRQDVAALRRQAFETDQSDARTNESLARVEAEARLAADRLAALHTICLDYRQAFDSRLGIAEHQSVADPLARIDAGLAAGDDAGRDAACLQLLDLGLAHAGRQTAGARFAGQAANAAGEVVGGRFAQVGPLAYFVSDDGALCGVAQAQAGSVYPAVFSGFDAEGSREISRLVEGGRGVVPVDPTLGYAVRIEQTRDTLWVHLWKGGPVMVPLLALGLFCAVVAAYKLITLGRTVNSTAEARIAEILTALDGGDRPRAQAIAASLRRPLGPVILEGLAHPEAGKEHLEEILYERLVTQTPALERLLSPLAVGASAAPLLGLLGTVTGMIHTFKLITVFGSGDAKLLSSGISEALITTEVGLMIAIPALLIHAYLSRRVRRAVSLTQQSAVMFLNGMSGRGAAPAAGGTTPCSGQ